MVFYGGYRKNFYDPIHRPQDAGNGWGDGMKHDPYCLHYPARRKLVRIKFKGCKPRFVEGMLFVCPRCELMEFTPQETPENWRADVNPFDWVLPEEFGL